MKKQIINILLVICMLFTFAPSTMYATSERVRPRTHFTDDFLADASEHQFEGVALDVYTLRQIIDGDRQIHQDFRVQYEDVGTITYRTPVQEEEVEYLISILDGDIQSFDANPFLVTQIMSSGRPHSDSIVVMLLGDGFTAACYGTWPNPSPGTVLYHAYNTMNTMLDTHPFGLFEDLFTVYLIHSTQPGQVAGFNGYLGTVAADGVLAPGGAVRQYRIRQLADAVVPRSQQTMIQVISNSNVTDTNGFAFVGWHYEFFATISVTSIRRIANGGTTPQWPGIPAWHGTFIHEFGHSFAALVDEHQTGRRDELRANSTAAPNADVKWRHWAGHRNVLEIPTRFGDGWAVPTIVGANSAQFSGCLMRASWGNRNFCGVCTAEIIRRLAFLTGETFHGKSSVTANFRPDIPSMPNTPIITIPQGATRILDSAFHGNTSLQMISIPPSVNTIGDFAFIGTTGLSTIHNFSTIPQQINATTFAGVNRANVEVHIPPGTTEAFIAAGWTGFRLIDTENPFSSVTAVPAILPYDGGSSVVTATGSGLIPSNVRIAAFLNNTGNALYIQTPSGTASSVSATIVFPTSDDPFDRVYNIRISTDGGVTWHFTPATVTLNAPLGIVLTPDITSATANVGAGIVGRVPIAVRNTSSVTRDVTLRGVEGSTDENDPALFNATGVRIAFQNFQNWNFSHTISLLPGETWRGFVGTGGNVARNYTVTAIWSDIPHVRWGDLNDNGVVDYADVTLLRRHIAGHPVTIHGNPDINGDGVVDYADVTLLRRYIAGHPVGPNAP